MSWLLDVLGVRGLWESKREVLRVLGGEGMNLSSRLWMQDAKHCTENTAVVQSLLQSRREKPGQEQYLPVLAEQVRGSQAALPSHHSGILSDCLPPEPRGLQIPLTSEESVFLKTHGALSSWKHCRWAKGKRDPGSHSLHAVGPGWCCGPTSSF